MYRIFRDDPTSHKEVYLARAPSGVFVSFDTPARSNLDFATAREAYEFAAEFPQLQYWHVGVR